MILFFDDPSLNVIQQLVQNLSYNINQLHKYKMQNNYYWPQFTLPYPSPNNINGSSPSFVEMPSPNSLKDARSSHYQELQTKCQRLQLQNQQLKKEILKAQNSEVARQKRKVQRRTQEELEKNFTCLFENCNKEYASTLALNLHMKKKHNAGTKKERDLLAEAILKAMKQGKQPPSSAINLPPNYLETYKEEKIQRSFKYRNQGSFIDDDSDEEEDESLWERQINEQWS